MRLIDADALLKAIIQMSPDGNVFDRIHEAPTIEPERKTGKWITEPNCYYRCSDCGTHYPSIGRYMDYNFCPNCGTKMEEGGV